MQDGLPAGCFQACPRLVAGFLALLAASLTSTGASAGHDVFHIFTPMVERGHWGFEVLTAAQTGLPRQRDHDHDDDHDDHADHGAVRAAHEIALYVGLTDSWMVKAALGTTREDGDDYIASSLAVENVFRFMPSARGPLDLAWFTALTAGLASGTPNAVEFGPIVSFEQGSLMLVLNPFLEKTFGENRKDGFAFAYAVRATYSLAEGVHIGVEAFGEIENLGNAPPVAGQSHRVGPVLYLGQLHGSGGHGLLSKSDESGYFEAHRQGHASHGQVSTPNSTSGEWHTEVGVLFGLTQSTPDVALKLNVGTHF